MLTPKQRPEPRAEKDSTLVRLVLGDAPNSGNPAGYLTELIEHNLGHARRVLRCPTEARKREARMALAFTHWLRAERRKVAC